MRSIQKTNRIDIDPSNLYRMPWTSSDNAFSWLEITRRCNLCCCYCYQKNRPGSDKDMAQAESDLQALRRLRICDTMFVSGGEPLLHPRLPEIIKRVRSMGFKPVIVSNGHALTADIVQELKKAGMFGFILHVDRGQSRPGWIGSSEKDLNRLRQYYADIIHDANGLVCGFNTTVLPKTLHCFLWHYSTGGRAGPFGPTSVPYAVILPCCSQKYGSKVS